MPQCSTEFLSDGWISIKHCSEICISLLCRMKSVCECLHLCVCMCLSECVRVLMVVCAVCVCVSK